MVWRTKMAVGNRTASSSIFYYISSESSDVDN